MLVDAGVNNDMSKRKRKKVASFSKGSLFAAHLHGPISFCLFIFIWQKSLKKRHYCTQQQHAAQIKAVQAFSKKIYRTMMVWLYIPHHQLGVHEVEWLGAAQQEDEEEYVIVCLATRSYVWLLYYTYIS